MSNAFKGWARRRLNTYLEDIKAYTGSIPESVTVWKHDFDLLCGYDSRIVLKCGPPKPMAR